MTQAAESNRSSNHCTAGVTAVLSRAGGVAFVGGLDRYFRAIDANNALYVCSLPDK